MDPTPKPKLLFSIFCCLVNVTKVQEIGNCSSSVCVCLRVSSLSYFFFVRRARDKRCNKIIRKMPEGKKEVRQRCARTSRMCQKKNKINQKTVNMNKPNRKEMKKITNGRNRCRCRCCGSDTTQQSRASQEGKSYSETHREPQFRQSVSF